MPVAAPDWVTRVTYAHRGLHGNGVPENSLSAARGAIARGLGIECDVRLSADGTVMVFHDATLDRLCGQPGTVAEMTAAELGAARLANGEPIPTLAALLALIDGRVPLLVEIKPWIDPAPVAEVLDTYAGPVAAMSFDPAVIAWFADHRPAFPRGLVVTERETPGPPDDARLAATRPDFCAWDVRDLPSVRAADLRARGMPVLTWTVRSPELADRARFHADAAIAEGDGL